MPRRSESPWTYLIGVLLVALFLSMGKYWIPWMLSASPVFRPYVTAPQKPLK